MAKSKSGGTRSYLRGRIASDVYSIGRDASGKKQQVVRSLAEQVKNPQTIAQMRGRMIMSTVMQAVSGLAQLIDHSFDGVLNGQPSISHFIRENYKKIKDDVADNPSGLNHFSLSPYQVKGVQAGEYLVSQGSANLPSAFVPASDVTFLLSITKTAAQTTFAQVREALGIAKDDYVTLVGIMSDNTVRFFRVSLNYDSDGATVLSNDNADRLFNIDNPLGLDITFNVSSTSIQIGGGTGSCYAIGAIFSQAVNGGFIHSTTSLVGQVSMDNTADTTLPTYPVGSERFLNGGEL